ncbi:MAG: adenylate/guanylate cyclase domain-containing protein, partial [Nitrospinae bacterium]|nr:adenylate/guanylate cyclase domain-containing protein [Nitrospinota bacterium]
DGPTVIGTPLLAFAGATLYRYGVEGARRRALQGAFSLYLSPAIVAKIAANPDALKLGGERRELTLFFCDLAGFTSLSERLSPEELVAVLNDYTTRVTDVILALDGTVDKYIGDAIMAFWNAPADQPDHPARAVEASLGAVEALSALNERLQADGLPLLSMRVGLNSGPAVVGNMGSTKRFNYTAMGDTVNEASRFEGLGKAYGTKILAAEPTATDPLVAERFLVRRVDFLTVKGKDRPVWAYEVMARLTEATDRQRRVKEDYEAALTHYLARRWDEAEALLDAILADAPDGPSATLKKRIAHFRAEPPEPDWNGVFTHTSK